MMQLNALEFYRIKKHFLKSERGQAFHQPVVYMPPPKKSNFDGSLKGLFSKIGVLVSNGSEPNSKQKGIFKFKEISVETKIPLLKHVSGNSEWLQFEMYVTLISRIIGPLNGAECQEPFILLLQLHLSKLDKKRKVKHLHIFLPRNCVCPEIASVSYETPLDKERKSSQKHEQVFLLHDPGAAAVLFCLLHPSRSCLQSPGGGQGPSGQAPYPSISN